MDSFFQCFNVFEINISHVLAILLFWELGKLIIIKNEREIHEKNYCHETFTHQKKDPSRVSSVLNCVFVLGNEGSFQRISVFIAECRL